jgi:hypothetical protein
MIQMHTAHTEEVDNFEAAVGEILHGIQSMPLRKNSVGILYCYHEFIAGGIVDAILQKLPFPCIGMTTARLSTNGLSDEIALSLSVLTSDSVEFQCGVVDNPNLCPLDAASQAFQQMKEGRTEPPKMVIAFTPMPSAILSTSLGEGVELNDELFRAANQDLPGVPFFGSVCITNEDDSSLASVIGDKKCSNTMLAMCALYGDVSPQFFSATMAGSETVLSGLEATEVVGNIIKKIDGKLPRDVLQEAGLPTDFAITDFPIRAYYPDGLVLVRTGQGTKEDGSLSLASGGMSQGAKLDFFQMTIEKLFEDTQTVVGTALKKAPARPLLVISCAARHWYCNARNQSEYKMLEGDLTGKVPFAMACSAGEIFPMPTQDGIRNVVHNNSLIICAL